MDNKYITVKEFLKEKGDDFKLKLVVGKKYLDKKILVSEVNRPGLSMAGFIDQFRAERGGAGDGWQF